MAKVTPEQIFPGFSSDGNHITIPLSSLPGLSAVEANGATGDIVEVLRIINETAYTQLKPLSDSNKPNNLTFDKSAPRGKGVDTFTQEYSWTFSLKINPQQLELETD